MKGIKLLMAGMIAILSLVSCSEDEPARMLWEVSGKPAGNVKTAIHYDYYPPVWITVGGYSGEATLKCTNYSNISIYGQKNAEGEYVDSDCRFTAKVTEPNIIKIDFDYMDEGFEEKSCYLEINGSNGTDKNATLITIIRKPFITD